MVRAPRGKVFLYSDVGTREVERSVKREVKLRYYPNGRLYRDCPLDVTFVSYTDSETGEQRVHVLVRQQNPNEGFTRTLADVETPAQI